MMIDDLRQHLQKGHVIPALPLALNRNRQWDQVSQQALVRYYMDAGVGGIAVAVHSTQFEIREPNIALFGPLLRFVMDVVINWTSIYAKRCMLIAGLCGRTDQATNEARLARDIGYHAGLLSLGAWKTNSESEILRHCRRVAREIPLIGFYLQPAVGGRSFSFRFWREFAEIPELLAIKIAPFDRYRTIDVVRAVCEAGRDEVALYTGNDDNIIADLLTPFRFGGRERYICGGLLGQWGVWTQAAVKLLNEIKLARGYPLAPEWLTRNAELSDANGAIFDAANGFRGCRPGIHEILRRQGLVHSRACLDENEKLAPGQAREISRVRRSYPWLSDDGFVTANLPRWRA